MGVFLYKKGPDRRSKRTSPRRSRLLPSVRQRGAAATSQTKGCCSGDLVPHRKKGKGGGEVMSVMSYSLFFIVLFSKPDDHHDRLLATKCYRLISGLLVIKKKRKSE
jgi:hypothetical protein